MEVMEELEHAKKIMRISLHNLRATREGKVLLSALNDYDADTYKHCINVAVFGVILGEEMNLPDEELHNIAVAGILHDVGKLCVDINILNKKGKLTDKEYSVMKKHVLYGNMLVTYLPISEDARRGIAEHHERLDHKGYSRGIAGSEISLIGRIMAVADVFDALTSVRPYHQGLGKNTVFQMMCKDASLDSDIVNTLISTANRPQNDSTKSYRFDRVY